MRIALSLFGFNRPHYLKEVLVALEGNASKDGIDFYYFQDGAVNRYSRMQWAKQDEIVASANCARASSLNFQVVVSPHNRGIAVQQVECTKALFKDLKYDAVIALTDDFKPSKYFLHTRKILINQFADDPKVFSVHHCYINHMSRARKRVALRKYIFCRNMPSPGGWVLFRDKWLDLLPLYAPYYNMISTLDYRGRPHRDIQDLLGGKITSQDAGYEWAFYKTDMYNVWPVVNRCKDIGHLGTNKRPQRDGPYAELTKLDEFEEDLSCNQFEHAPAYTKGLWMLKDRR